MKTLRYIALAAVGALGLVAPRTATAQEAPPPGEEQYTYPTERRTNLVDRFGVAVSLGGGVQDFTESDLRDITGTGGTWNVRVAGGTKMIVGVELAYSGSAQALDIFGVDNDAKLISNGIEGAVRLNVLPRSPVLPYIFGGAGWRRYFVHSDFNTSDVRDHDNILELPVGAGVAWRYSGFVLDGRFTFRPALDSDLTRTGDLHSWAVAANAGWEF